MELFERLGKVLSASKAKRAEFALTTGMGGDRLDNLINGKVKKLRPEEAQAIRANFGFSEHWLLTGEGAERVPENEKKVWQVMDQARLVARDVTPHALNADQANFVTSLIFLHNSKKSDELKQFLDDRGIGASGIHDYVLVPHHNVQASAGGGSIISDESVVDHLAFKRDWITQSLGCQPDKICVIQVRGDSMTPTINDADLLLLDLREISQRTEGVYVIQLDGSLLVKRISYKINGSVEVISDNARYGTQTLTESQGKDLAFIGRVVWHGRKF
jgi:phage repressor protein C with HTH and peptisase S24 domain